MSKQTKSQFHTLAGYRMLENAGVTEAMEDYLEMILRSGGGYQPVRITRLAELLNVRPSSATKMAGRLRELGLVDYEPYGLLTLTSKGRELGDYFFWRHEVLARFFSTLNGADSPLELVERIEHFVDRTTLLNMEAALEEGRLIPL